jgi:hypothetical protein
MRLAPYKRMTSLEIVAASAIYNKYHAMAKRRVQVGISVPFAAWLSNPDALLIHYCWENNAVSRTCSASEMSVCDAAHRIRELDALVRKSGCSIEKLWAMVNTASDTGTFDLHCFRCVETAPSRLWEPVSFVKLIVDQNCWRLCRLTEVGNCVGEVRFRILT